MSASLWWWCLIGVLGTAATAFTVNLVASRARAGWALVAAGAVVVSATGIVSAGLDLTGREVGAVLLVPGLLAYPLLAAGMVMIRRATGVLRITDLLDASIAALGAFLVVWIVFWHPHFHTNGILVTSTVAHPIGASVVFAAAVALALSRSVGRVGGVLLTAAASVLLAMTSILAVTVTATRFGVAQVPAAPVLWALFPVLLAGVGLAAWSPRLSPASVEPTPLTPWRIAMIVACAVLGPVTWVVIVTNDPHHRALAETVVPVTTDAVLSLLVLLRLLLTNAALQRARDRLAHTATRDPLTGLPNRAALMTALDDAFSTSDGRTPALLLFDLDGFKQTNDRLGHQVGDAVLCTVAQLVSQSVPPSATVARLGGDEFAIVVADARPSDVAHLAERVCADLGRRYSVHGHELHLSASLGVAHADGVRLTPTDAVHHADVALYAAKADARGRWKAYSATTGTNQ